MLDGISATDVVTTLNKILGPGGIAWCDGGVADGYWARTLADVATVEPMFTIASWDRLATGFSQLAHARMLDWLQRTPPRHRARDDAERLMKAIARGLGLRHGISIDLVVTGGEPDRPLA